MPFGSQFRSLIVAGGTDSGVGTPGAIDFDGTNDYLSRSSDLSGNADGKTFTFSAWVYINSSQSNILYEVNDAAPSVNYFIVYTNSSNELIFFASNSSGSNVLDGAVSNIQNNTWYHVLISIDLTNSSNRYVYINDEEASVTWEQYTNDDIDFTINGHGVGGRFNGSFGVLNGRLAHVYLDYTYRDLSTTSNRRNFITADGKPADGQAALSPILYLPLTDATSPGTNNGTGGDFTLNGTVALSGRGPNQYNAAASTFDGSADYLSRTSAPTGIADGKAFTIAFNVKNAGDGCIFDNRDGAGRGVNVEISGDDLIFAARNASNTIILNAFTTASSLLSKDKWHHVSISVDLSNTSNRDVKINGVSVAMTYSTYTDDNIDFTRPPYAVGQRANSGGAFFPGELSDFWFDDSYTADLSGFYDTDTGKPKYLGADGSEPTGSQPLIYLPLRSDDAGSNKGTGGDFTVNSGPYTGARGPSEFWGESAEFNGSTQNLGRTSALSGASNGKAFSLALALNIDNTSGQDYIFTLTDASDATQYLTLLANLGDLSLSGRNSGGTQILDASNSGTFSAGNWQTILISVDLTNSSNRSVYFNGSAVSVTWSTFTNDDLNFAAPRAGIAAIGNTGGGNFDGKIGFLWFNTEYIDFSDEANRLKFFDAFNYPVDLGADGSTPTESQPLIYMNNGFHNGTNLGSGGDFTPQNSPTDGGFVRG